MSKERKIDDSELENVSGAGDLDHVAPGDSTNEPQPGTGKVDVPPAGSGGDSPEPQGDDGPGYQHYG
jgi:hypothetical protein